MRRLIASAEWDAEAARDDPCVYAVERLGDAGGVLVVDETDTLRTGDGSAGVRRESSGPAGGGSRTVRSGCSWRTHPSTGTP